MSNAATLARKSFDSPQQEVYLSLWRTYDRLKALEEQLFSQHDLTPQQYNALRLLKAAHPAGMPTLSLGAKLISRAPDMTRMLDRLAERGLVARNRLAENRRVVEVAITEAGLTLLAELREPLAECHQKQLGHLSPAALEQLSILLAEARAPHEPSESGWQADAAKEGNA